MKETIEIKGMHCHSCEVLVEDKLKQIPGVTKAYASVKNNNVTIYSKDPVSRKAIIDAIQSAGYQIGKENQPLVRLSLNDGLVIVVSFLAIALVYLLASRIGLSRLLTINGSAATSLAVVFTIGVTAGLSTCMALVGGLVLGASAKYAESHPDATAGEKFRPHLFFNLGRIISFFVLGGLIGGLGSFFKLTSVYTGAITLIVGLFMFLLGVQLLEVFPRFSFRLTLPKGLSKLLGLNTAQGNEYSHKNSMLLGALTFFLPCGFTQAMQVYAVSTGSVLSGALVMGVFALGTTPGLLSIGGLASLLKRGRYANFFYKFVGVLVIILAAYNFSNGLNLTGLRPFLENAIQTKSSKINNESPSESKRANETNNVQIFKATYDTENVLTPKKFTVKVNQPVKIEIYAKDNGEGCMGSIMIPNLVNQPQFFVKGETISLEFTPKRTGKYYLTCAMGVPAGQIEVVN